MSFLKNIFNKKDEPIKTYADFWQWFQKHELGFYKAIRSNENIEEKFIEVIGPKLQELNESLYFLAGMKDDETAELIITAEGEVKTFYFVEELVKSAPIIKGWLFTALKPALPSEDVNINMGGYEFNSDNISFFCNEIDGYPDEIDITAVHNQLNEENHKAITSGTNIYLDNYLGELYYATTIDNLKVIGMGEAEKELIPIAKLKDFLVWREKEFIEKYEGTRHNTENDIYVGLEGKLKNGRGLIAIINKELLHWDRKASHPWILNIEIKYKGENGMPDKEIMALMDEIEDKIMLELKDFDGYLNIGRQTGDDLREIYFACKEFRKPSKVMNTIQNNYLDTIEIQFVIYKDKYWRAFDRFL